MSTWFNAWHITWQRGCFWTVQTLRFESTKAAGVCMFYLALKSTSTGCLSGVWATEPSLDLHWRAGRVAAAAGCSCKQAFGQCLTLLDRERPWTECFRGCSELQGMLQQGSQLCVPGGCDFRQPGVSSILCALVLFTSSEEARAPSAADSVYFLAALHNQACISAAG